MMRTLSWRTGLLAASLCWLTWPAQGAEQEAGESASRPRVSLTAYRRQAAPARPRSAGVHWTFHDIEIQTLLGRLKRFGVELPLPATGRVSVRISLSAPWRSIFRAGTYEVDGDLTAAALTISGIELKNLTVHLQYKEGVLDLSEMRFTVPGQGGADGTISGTAHMQVQPAGDLNANLSIERLPLSALAGAVPALTGQISGSVSGQFNGHAPADRLRDLSAWEAEGRLTLSKLLAFGLPAVDATTDLRLSRGRATLTQLTAELEGAHIGASGQLALMAPYAFSSRLRMNVPDLSWLNRLKADFRPPVPVAGDFSLSAEANGQLTPKSVRLRGTLEGRNLKADNMTIDRLLVPYDGTIERVRVRNLRLELYGGRIAANLNLPTTRDGNVGAGVRIDNVDLARAASDLLGQKQSWRGAASGSFQLQAPALRLDQLDAWSGTGRLTFGRGMLFGIGLSRLDTRIQVATGRLNVTELVMESALARITGSAHADLTAPFGFGTALRIADVDFAQLNQLPLEFRPPVAVAGRAGISLRAEGALQPFDFTARGGVATRRLRADRLLVDSLNFNYQLSPQVLRLSQIAGAVYGGRIDGSASLPLGEGGHSQVALSWRQIDVRRMLAAVNADARGVRSQGRTSGQISAQADGNARELANWQATARVDLAGLQINQAAIGRASFDASLAKQVLNVSRIASQGGPMGVNGTASFALAAPHDFSLKLNVTNADLSIANTLPAALRPPATVGGTANVSANLKGQLGPLNIQGTGQVRVRNLRFDRARFDSLSFKFSGQNDLLKISELALVAYRGRLDGQVSLPLAANGAGAIDVRWQRINVGGLLTDLRGVAIRAIAANGGASTLRDALSQTRLEGWTWGSLSVHAPPGKLLDPAAWTGKVEIALAAMRLFGWTAKQGFIRGGIADGRADLTRLAFDLDGTRLRGSARLNLSQPHDFDSRFSLDNLQLSDFNNLPEAIRPPVTLSGTVSVSLAAQGTLDPLEVTGNGSMTGNKLQAGAARVDHVAIRFDAEKDRLALTNFQAGLYGGQITGDAVVALQGDEAGRVDFNWQEIDVGQLITDLAKLPVTLRGTLAGHLHVGIPIHKFADPLAWNVAASFDTSPLGTRSTPLAELHGRLTYNGQLLDYRLDGELLRGAIDLAGRWQPRPSAATAVNEGHFHLSGIRLEAITPLTGTQAAMDSFTGTIGAEVEYRHTENGLPVGSGEVSIDGLRLNGHDVLDELRGSVRLAENRVEVTNVDASLGGGALNLSGLIFLDPRRRGSFRLNVSGADVAELLAPWPQIASKVRGVVDAQLQGFFGGRRPLILTGIIALARGHVVGIDVNGVRVPVNGSIDPLSGRGTMELHGITGQVAHGRITGDFDVTLANGLGLNGRGKLADVDLRTLLQQSASASRLASGKISGSYTLAGRNIRTINDLTGTLDATLRDTQAMSLPVLERTTAYLTGGISGGTTFDEGTVRGSLARGVIRVERFSLSSGSAQIYAQGKVTLTGRLDLNVTVNTGQLNVPRRTLSLLASRILLVAAPPVGLLLNITQFLSNQVINLEVTGTIRAPTVRIRPLNLLGQEAAQFFLLQALP